MYTNKSRIFVAKDMAFMLEYILLFISFLFFVLFIIQNEFKFKPFDTLVDNIRVSIFPPSFTVDENLHFYKGRIILEYEQDISSKNKTRTIVLYFSNKVYQPNNLLNYISFHQSLNSISLACFENDKLSHLDLLLCIDELKKWMENNKYEDAFIYIPLCESFEPSHITDEAKEIIYSEFKRNFTNKIHIIN